MHEFDLPTDIDRAGPDRRLVSGRDRVLVLIAAVVLVALLCVALLLGGGAPGQDSREGSSPNLVTGR